MNAIGYVRISTKDQSNYSLDYQESSVKEYCIRYHVNLLALFKDDGESSYSFDRPDWIALEEFIKNHKGKVQYLIVMDHDRFSRNLPEALLKIGHLEKKFGIKVLATNEPIDLDTSDPSVFLQRAFKYLMANDELFRIRKRTTQGIRQALEGGRFVNRAPFGYKNEKDAGGRGIIVIDEERSFIIKKIFTDFVAGSQMMPIYLQVRRLGFTYKGNSAIQRVLKNCVYAGFIKVPASKKGPEKYVKGIHKPIINEYDFWRAQQILDNKKPLKTLPNDEVPLRGILKCHCGLFMTGGNSKGKRKYYTYYRCQKHNNINLSAITLHGKLLQIFELLSFSPGQLEYITKSSKIKMDDALLNRGKLLKLKSQQLGEINKKIERNEERLMNDDIGPDTYKRWDRRFLEQKALLTEEIKILNQDRNKNWMNLQQHLPFLTSLPALYEKCDINQKHSLLRVVFKLGLIYFDGSYRTPWLNPALLHNYLKIKEKGLLIIEQSGEDLGDVPLRTRDGS